MSAALFVGRVGGLAVALGVGAAVFNGVGVASADSGAFQQLRNRRTCSYAPGCSVRSCGCR